MNLINLNTILFLSQDFFNKRHAAQISGVISHFDRIIKTK